MDSTHLSQRLPKLPQGFVALLFGFSGIVTFVLQLWHSRPRTNQLWDFFWFYLSGAAGRAGLSPYDISLAQSLFERGTVYTALRASAYHSANLNPPTLTPLFECFTFLNPFPAFVAWWAITLLVYLGLVVWLSRLVSGDAERFAFIGLALGSAALASTLELGQIYAVLGLLSAFAFTYLNHHRPRPAAAALGILATFKPNFALLLFAFPLTAHWAALGSAGLAVAAVVLLTTLRYGVVSFYAWQEQIGELPRILLTRNITDNMSWWGIQPFELSAAIVILALIGAGMALRRGRHDVLLTSEILLVLSVALSPLGWIGYSMALLPVLARHFDLALVRLAMVLWLVPNSVASTLPIALYETGISLIFLALVQRALRTTSSRYS